jgi:hypothetical protein
VIRPGAARHPVGCEPSRETTEAPRGGSDGTVSMDGGRRHTPVAPEHAPDPGAGVVESGDGAQSLVRADGGEPVLGAGARAGGGRGAPAPAGVVLRGRRQGGSQAGDQAAGGAGGGLLRAPAAVGAVLVGGAATGAGARRDDAGHHLRGAGGQRGVPRVRRPGGLGDPAGRGAARLETRVAAPAPAPAPGGAGHDARDRAGGSGAVRALAVRAHPAPAGGIPSCG